MKKEINIYLPSGILLPTLLAGAVIGCAIANYIVN